MIYSMTVQNIMIFLSSTFIEKVISTITYEFGKCLEKKNTFNTLDSLRILYKLNLADTELEFTVQSLFNCIHK